MTETINWDQFDKQVSTEEIQNAVNDAKNNDYPEIPDGTYEVALEDIVLKTSKKGDPMLTITFVILEGEYNNNKIWYNGVMQPNNEKAIGYQVHKNNIMLRSLLEQEEDNESRVFFKGFNQYNDLVLDLAEELVEAEFALEITTDKKGYQQYKIIEVFEVE
ncbi:DUF669 domain-containing protein [Staphylococcus hominis]|uniref:DUF669 domain-containing protein n=1 Tax=Staphylococcus hominis TaxID=1290 RepID=UPI0012DFE41C|nr:DUF669 domain-containing protein [Staphylococcus hominis]MDS0980482.1 DUF669 domain-containing protein [Staphylococcus hominis]QGR78541.1 DUF669 domain-containing protein [Staphylococcus hominis]